jgi:hypothetical protein
MNEPFGGCSCSLGLVQCNCTQACELDEWEPVPDRKAILMLSPFVLVWVAAVVAWWRW